MFGCKNLVENWVFFRCQQLFGDGFQRFQISDGFADRFVSSKVQKINAQLKEKKNKLAPQIKAAVNFTVEL